MSIFWRPNGAVLDYEFAELSGSIVYDLSGNNNNGSITGPDWRRGPLIGSLYVDGSTKYMVIPDSPSLDLNTNITIEILLRGLTTTNVNVNTHIFIKYEAGVSAYGLFNRYGANPITFEIFDGTT